MLGGYFQGSVAAAGYTDTLSLVGNGRADLASGERAKKKAVGHCMCCIDGGKVDYWYDVERAWRCECLPMLVASVMHARCV